MNDAWSRWRSHRADPPPPNTQRRLGPASAGGNGADTASWLASRGWGDGSTEDATTRGRPDGESWNGRGQPPETPVRSSRRECLCLRVGTCETGFGPCSRDAAPSRERTTDWNGTGTRQRCGADGRIEVTLVTAAARDGEGRRRAGRAMVFHPPIRHDEANRWSGRPETGARERMREQNSSWRDATGNGGHERRQPRETGGVETTRPTGATSGMRAGMHTSSSQPARWFARRLGALGACPIERSGRVSDARYPPSRDRGRARSSDLRV